MLLRSSSTPVLGSLLSSFSESPSRHHHHCEPHPAKHSPASIHQSPSKLSFHQSGHLNLTYSNSSSPISPTVAHSSAEAALVQRTHNSIRRAQSEGNLEGLLNEEFGVSVQHNKKTPSKPRCSVLQTIPSFSYRNSDGKEEEEEEGIDSIEDEEEGREVQYPTGGEGSSSTMEMMTGGELQSMVLNGEMRFLDEFKYSDFERNDMEMHLARGLGVTTGFGGGGNGGDDFIPLAFGRDRGEANGIHAEEHYKKLVEENPSNPLFLRNYAQFLYQTKQDPKKAEEYYSRAILADPKDGEIMSQYAKLIWELHHDPDRATSYFERAVQAAPEDSHVQAAYASFLWEAEEGDGEDEDGSWNNHNVAIPLPKKAMAFSTA